MRRRLLGFLTDDAMSCSSPILLIRHGEKENPPDDDPFMDVALNDNGIKDSHTLGGLLRMMFDTPLTAIHSSPLKRCVMTSENITEGYGIDLDIKTSNVLGDPGPYVKDEKIAVESFLKIYPDNIVKRHFDGEMIPGFRSLEEGSSMILKYLFENRDNGISIHITHDVIIASLIGYLTGKIRDVENWIGYHEGICFFDKEGSFFMDCTEGQFNVDEKLLSTL